MKYSVYLTMPVTFCVEVEANSAEEARLSIDPNDLTNDDIDSIDYNDINIEVIH